MTKRLMLGAAMLAFAAMPAHAQKEVKIGFVSTFSGPVAVIGNDMRTAFNLALDHMGHKMGGRPVQVAGTPALAALVEPSRRDAGSRRAQPVGARRREVRRSQGVGLHEGFAVAQCRLGRVEGDLVVAEVVGHFLLQGGGVHGRHSDQGHHQQNQQAHDQHRASLVHCAAAGKALDGHCSLAHGCHIRPRLRSLMVSVNIRRRYRSL